MRTDDVFTHVRLIIDIINIGDIIEILYKEITNRKIH